MRERVVRHPKPQNVPPFGDDLFFLAFFWLALRTLTFCVSICAIIRRLRV